MVDELSEGFIKEYEKSTNSFYFYKNTYPDIKLESRHLSEIIKIFKLVIEENALKIKKIKKIFISNS